MREIIADSRMMHIGKNGEGDALRVTFPVVAEWEALYGAGGVWTLNVQRHGDALAYAAQDFKIEDGEALWVVTDADAAVVGEGRCELTYKIGGTVAKSRTYSFRVDRSLTGGGDVPDPVKGWQEALEERVDGKLDRPDGGSAGDVLTKTGDGEEWKKPTGENVVYIAKTGTDTYAVKRNASDENPMPFAELLAMAKAPSTTVAVFDRYRLPLAALTDTGMMFESVYSATVFTVLVMQDNSAYQQSVTVMNAPLTDALEIPAWALSENKPTYTASEVGAVASQQAVADAGKVLTVGDDGKVVAKEASGGSDLSLGLTSAQVGQIVKVKAVDENGKPTQWETANDGENWEKVADVTVTETVKVIRVTFDACSVVYVQLQYGGVEDDLGNIGIYPNQGETPYTGENRSAAAATKTSQTNKKGYLFVTIDVRKGDKWTAASDTKSRDDGGFGEITPDALMNCDVGINNNRSFSMISNYYFTNRNESVENGVKSITAYGAGMAKGTTMRVWGIKK